MKKKIVNYVKNNYGKLLLLLVIILMLYFKAKETARGLLVPAPLIANKYNKADEKVTYFHA